MRRRKTRIGYRQTQEGKTSLEREQERRRESVCVCARGKKRKEAEDGHQPRRLLLPGHFFLPFRQRLLLQRSTAELNLKESEQDA